jgi:hypothetical protein
MFTGERHEQRSMHAAAYIYLRVWIVAYVLEDVGETGPVQDEAS